MLGEGMPWHIILVFMMLGVLMGINSGKKDQRKEEEELKNTTNAKASTDESINGM